MKKGLIFLGLISCAAFTALAGRVYAGGCCYKYFSATDGVAGTQDAQISVAFVDPINTFADPGKTTFNSLTNQKIDVHVASARPGQFCLTNSEKTNSEGHIDAHCASPFSGTMSIYFTAPDMDAQANGMISSVAKTVNFLPNPNAPAETDTPTPFPSPVSTNTTIPTSTPTTVQQETQGSSASETAELQKRVDSLEAKVAEQGKQVSMLQKIINSLLGFFNRLFH